MKKFIAQIISLLTALAAQTAFAHPGHDVSSGAMAGFMHPFTGLDHLIALMCLGALLAAAPARVRWLGVATLLLVLAVGAGIGLAGVTLPASEWMIALSVLVAGLMLVRSGGTRPTLLIGGSAVFALFHGYAHGVESSGEALAFVAGFLGASFAIVATSMLATNLFVQRRALRIAFGGGAALTGLLLLSTLAL